MARRGLCACLLAFLLLESDARSPGASKIAPLPMLRGKAAAAEEEAAVAPLAAERASFSSRALGLHQVVPAASVVSGQGPASEYEQQAKTAWWVSWGISLAIFAVASFFVHKWHSEMKDQGITTTFCGWKSILCCLCCTFLTICWPIDEGTKGVESLNR